MAESIVLWLVQCEPIAKDFITAALVNQNGIRTIFGMFSQLITSFWLIVRCCSSQKRAEQLFASSMFDRNEKWIRLPDELVSRPMCGLRKTSSSSIDERRKVEKRNISGWLESVDKCEHTNLGSVGRTSTSGRCSTRSNYWRKFRPTNHNVHFDFDLLFDRQLCVHRRLEVQNYATSSISKSTDRCSNHVQAKRHPVGN